jgi:hypothetical protein
LEGVLSSLLMVVHGTWIVSSPLEVQGDLTRNFVRPAAVGGLLLPADVFVQPDPLVDSKAVIKDIPVESMDKTIACGDRPVGLFRGTGGL